jgi:lysyl-tRNA synthetase class 2
MKTWQKLKTNPELWPKYFLREKIIKGIRSYFDSQGFHEVETPVLVPYPAAESYLEVFETTLFDRNRKPTKLYLSTSPELALKKLMVAGLGNCYSLTKSFRNMETQSNLHNPEFTILEWYRVGASYRDIMTDCENLILYVTKHILPTIKQCTNVTISYANQKIDLTPPWPRVSVKDAFQRWANIDLIDFFDIENARSISLNKGYTVSSGNTWEELYNQIFLNEIEPKLPKDAPVFLYDFPGAVAALARKNPRDPRFAQRFELYIGGLEMADCYQELTNWKEQKKRFEKELKEVKRLGKTIYEYDRDFINALKEGLGECAGIALGVDRLIMLLGDIKTIDDSLFFPLVDIV